MTRRHRHRLAPHHLAVLAVLSTMTMTTVLPGAAAIEDLDAEDVPPECALACAPVAQLTERCETAAAAVDRRWTTGKQQSRENAVDGDLNREARRHRGTRRSLQRMLGTRLGRRQEEGDGESSEDSDDSDSSDDSDEEEEEEDDDDDKNPPASGSAAETGESEEAIESAMRACVCEEKGFDVAVAAFGCAACVAAQNATAVDASEDIRQIMADCGFIAATDPPPLTITTTTTTTTTPRTVSRTAMTTLPPLLLAPGEPPSPSASPPSSPASPTSTSFPSAATRVAPPTPVTPVTVFETPSFSALPPLVPPNDVSSAPPVLEQDENQMSGAARGPGGALGGWLETRRVVLVVIIGMVLS